MDSFNNNIYHWISTNRKHFTDYKIIIKRDGKDFYEYDLDFKDKGIYIHYFK